MSDDDFGPAQRGGRGGRRGDDVRPLRSEDRPAPQREEGAGAPPRGGTATAAPEDDFGPVQRGRGPRIPRPRLPARERRGRRRRRGRVGVGTVAVILLVAVVGYAAVLAVLASVRLDRTEVDGLRSAGPLRANVLVAGSDTREGLTEEQLRELGTHRVGGGRSDTLFLLSTDGLNAAMLAFPRDLYVTRCDGQRARINTAGADQVGGPSCLVRTVADLTGLPVSHYMELDLAGFVDVVDAVGGITVTLEEPLVDRAAGADLPAGTQQLDGREALGFVRARQVGGDLARIERQQQFMSALSQRLASPTTWLNPVRLWNTTGAGAAALTADSGFGPLDMARVGLGVAGAGSDMPTYTVPATPQSVGGAAVLMPDEAGAADLFRSFEDGSALRASGEPDGEPEQP